MVVRLLDESCNVTSFDNLLGGYRDAVLGGEFSEGDLADTKLLDTVFQQYDFDAVMHFAGFIQVGESVKDPAKYYRNNVTNVVDLLDVMLRHQVKKLIF